MYTYKYPGDYTVVLNGACNGVNAVSRTIVHALSPDITLLAILKGDVQIINNIVGTEFLDWAFWNLSLLNFTDF